MPAHYTAIVQQREQFWIGWIEEIPGVLRWEAPDPASNKPVRKSSMRIVA